MLLTNCKEIDEYIDLVRNGEYRQCKEQYLFCDLIEKIFKDEDIYVDNEQLQKYLNLQKYFSYKLFPWEKCLFALHNCTYDKNGLLRFPVLVCIVGRGSGKNGYLAFEDFALLTTINGVRNYDIDIFATSEEQAQASWKDVYDVLECNETKMKKHFYWNKERIINLDTNSEFRFKTSNPKTKDGGRPGKVDFDEYHAYENYKLIQVAVTGLGKKKHSRRTIISTDGYIRGGPFDDLKGKSLKILNFEIEDNGTLPFICQLDDEKEVTDPLNWYKANPSLQYLPDLLHEIKLEYGDYMLNPAANSSFMTKRMNMSPKIAENAVTSWNNILATNQAIDENLIFGKQCVAGIDYAKTNDFIGAGLLYRIDSKDYWISHTWVCRASEDLSRIKAPLNEWERQGLLTFVDGLEIPADMPVIWLLNEANKRQSKIIKVGIDNYRYALMQRAIGDIIFPYAEKIKDYVTLLRPSDEMKIIPILTSGFINHKYAWGDNPIMRWACNNSKTETVGINTIIGKIEPKSRKTDPFKAFVAAECVSDVLDVKAFNDIPADLDKTYTY